MIYTLQYLSPLNKKKKSKYVPADINTFNSINVSKEFIRYYKLINIVRLHFKLFKNHIIIRKKLVKLLKFQKCFTNTLYM